MLTHVHQALFIDNAHHDNFVSVVVALFRVYGKGRRRGTNCTVERSIDGCGHDLRGERRRRF
jgi:hypothetical protein